MNRRAEKGGNGSASRISHRSLVVIVALAVLLVGVVTALSMQIIQKQRAAVMEMPAEKVAQAAKRAGRNYVTANAFGQPVVANRQTGEFRPLTQDESARLAEGLKQLINQSTDDLVAVEQKDGTISMDLQGHFQNVMLAKRDENGTVSDECVDNLQAAADFFEIDPKLVGLTSSRITARPSAPKVEDR